jgi:Xaa-Pro aminopeptidase
VLSWVAVRSLAHIEGPSRLAALRRNLVDARLDVLIVTDPVGVHYLTGFARDAFAMVLVAADWTVPVTVKGYVAEAQQLAGGSNETLCRPASWVASTCHRPPPAPTAVRAARGAESVHETRSASWGR